MGAFTPTDSSSPTVLVPSTTPGTGAFSGIPFNSGITDSTYGDLGGSYGLFDYVYGGFELQYAATSGFGVGSFTPTSTTAPTALVPA